MVPSFRQGCPPCVCHPIAHKMRRSAAPSKLQPLAKRPKFQPIFMDSSANAGFVHPLPAPSRPEIPGEHEGGCGGDGCGSVSPAPVFPPPASKAHPSNSRPSTGGFRTPLTSVSKQNLAPAGNPPSESYGYFSVMWCKASKKKHKKWEGDAVLVTHRRTAILSDMEGKEIGKATGYKATELASLKEDETLFIGGKEIQVMSLLTEESYKSGWCFMGDSATSVTESPTPPIIKVSKPYVNPYKENSARNSGHNKPVTTPAEATCRFDPAAPGALVMPRPSPAHQWEHNKKESPVVDVVVDPYLSQHLRPHQRDGVRFLYECIMGMRGYSGSGAILADDMGLGKTLQCICLLWTLLRQGPYGGKPVVKKAIIITPGSLVKNWKQEFKKWLGSERLHTFAVGQDNRVEEFTKITCPVMIISYEMFVRSAELINSLNFDIVICDEGHRLKNTTIKTTSLIMSLASRRRVVLSGTPIQNDLQEFFSIVEFVNPGILGSMSAFRAVYEDPIVRAREPSSTPDDIDKGEKRAAELARLTKLFVLRRTQDVNNKYLLPKVDIVVFCRPSALQLSLYRKLLCSRAVRSCLSAGYSGAHTGSPHLVCIAALKKLCNHPALLYPSVVAAESAASEADDTSSIYHDLLPVYPPTFDPAQPEVTDSGKLVTLAALLWSLYSDGPRERVVLVSNHTKTLDMLGEFCSSQGYKCLRLDGQTPTAQRQALVQRFNSPYAQEFVFLLSSKAGGVGLNLIGASRLVLYDIDWNPANDLQAMARVWRDGQRKRVFIYRLITTGSLEEKIYQRQISKQGLSGAVVDVKERGDVQFAQEDLRDLFSVNETTQCETHDLLTCPCDSEDPGAEVRKGQTTQAPNHRACQLGQSTSRKKSKQNLTMDELLDWRHTRADPQTFPPDWHLSAAGGSVSYLFWNETPRHLTAALDAS